MSDEPKGTDAIRAEIAQAYRNHKAEPCLSMGLRTEVGVHELCDKHYDAGKTESIEHCAVCKLEAENKALKKTMDEDNAEITRLVTIVMELTDGQ